jgi:hypothetical protein
MRSANIPKAICATVIFGLRDSALALVLFFEAGDLDGILGFLYLMRYSII